MSSGVLVERFSPTVGRWMGVFGAGCLLLAALLTAWLGQSASAFVACAVLLWGALVVHVALIRPTVHAYDDHLLLRNMLRDTEVPWHLIEDVAVRQTTQVYVGATVHHGIAIGQSVRQMVKQQHRERLDSSGGMLGMGRLAALADERTLEHAASTAASYPTYVETRLSELAAQQKVASRGREHVLRRWAPLESGALAVATAGMLLLIVVG
jgi:hypothetical protein